MLNIHWCQSICFVRHFFLEKCSLGLHLSNVVIRNGVHLFHLNLYGPFSVDSYLWFYLNNRNDISDSTQHFRLSMSSFIPRASHFTATTNDESTITNTNTNTNAQSNLYLNKSIGFIWRFKPKMLFSGIDNYIIHSS